MRALLQRVTEAKVTIDEQVHGEIRGGLLILLGIEDADGPEDIQWLTNKIAKLRIFSDDQGLMNRSIVDIGGDALVVSQFTLYASVKKGARPSFIRSAKPSTAIPLYEDFISALEAQLGRPVATGDFGADMKVQLLNDGPVTIWIDSKNRE